MCFRVAANRRRLFCADRSGDSATYTEKFYSAFRTLDCEPSHLALCSTQWVASRLRPEQGRHLCRGRKYSKPYGAVARLGFGLDFSRSIGQGNCFSRHSAGANCWFEECVTDSIPGELTAMKCLDFCRAAFCPHYDGEVQKTSSTGWLRIIKIIPSGSGG